MPVCDHHAAHVWRTVHAEMTRRAERDYSKPSAAGMIYVLRFGDRIKIGWTATLARRMTEIPHDEVLATKRGTMLEEAALLQKFAPLCLTGEWFKDDPEIRVFVEQWAA